MQRRSDLDLEHFKALLLEEKERLQRRIDEVSRETRELEASADGAEDPADAAEIESQNTVDQRLIEDLRHQLDDVELALQKIEKGTYGLCEKTGKPIPLERLEAYPAARTISAE